MTIAFTRRVSQAANALLALALLTALLSFRVSLELFFAGCVLHAVAALPAVLRGPAAASPQDEPAPVPALQ